MKTKYTVALVNKSKIEWCRENPDKLTRKQRAEARLHPMTHGALPELICPGMDSLAQAQREADLHSSTHLAIITQK